MVTRIEIQLDFFKLGAPILIVLGRAGGLGASQSARCNTHKDASVWVEKEKTLGFPYRSISLPKYSPIVSARDCPRLFSRTICPLSIMPKKFPDRPFLMICDPEVKLILFSLDSRYRRRFGGSFPKKPIFFRAGAGSVSFIVLSAIKNLLLGNSHQISQLPNLIELFLVRL